MTDLSPRQRIAAALRLAQRRGAPLDWLAPTDTARDLILGAHTALGTGVVRAEVWLCA